MSIFDFIFRGKKATAAKRRSIGGTFNPGPILNSSGIVEVTGAFQASRIAAVYRCVEVLSGSVACLPIRKMRRNRAEGYFVEVDPRQDPTAYIIGTRPNGHQTAYELKRNLVAQLLLEGNAYVIPRYQGGRLHELLLCSPHTVTHDAVTDTYRVTDIYNGINGERFTADEIIHIRNFSLDGGRTGISTLSYAAQVLGIQATADKQTQSIFAKGGRIKGILGGAQDPTVGFGEYDDSELKNLAKDFAADLENQDIVSLPGQVSFSPISMTAVDMQLLEHKKFGVQEICRFFGVHPDKVFCSQSNNYKASDMAQVGFITDTLQPILRKIEAELNAKLIAPELAGDYKFTFDISPLLMTDLTTEASYMTSTISAGVMTVNEWRRRKDLRPVQGGDVTFISCNVAPIDSPKIKGVDASQQSAQEPTVELKVKETEAETEEPEQEPAEGPGINDQE